MSSAVVAGQAPIPPTTRALLSLAWPIVVSRSTQTVVGLCDALMVATLGETALAASTTGAMNAYVLMMLPMGVCFIIASFASQLHGRGETLSARRYGFYGLIIAGVTQLLCVAAIPLVGVALGALDYNGELLRLMSSYLVIRLMSGGAMIGMEALGSYYGGIGNTQLPMRCNILAMVLNVALNWVLIGGHLGAPALGVAGAALASTLSTWIAFLVLFGIFLRDGKRAGRVVPQLAMADFKRMLRFGLPAGLNWFFEFLAFMFFVNVVVAGLGTTALAAMMSVLQINSVSMMPAFGLASAGAILVGQRIGAGEQALVPRVVWLTFRVAAAWQGLVGLAYLLLPELLFTPFAQGHPAEAQALREVGARMLMLSAAWQLLDATVNTLAEALRAAGDTAWPLYARIAIGWILFAPGSYLSVRVLGGGDLVAVGWVVGYMAVLAAVIFLRFRSGAWRKMELIEPTVD